MEDFEAKYKGIKITRNKTNFETDMNLKGDKIFRSNISVLMHDIDTYIELEKMVGWDIVTYGIVNNLWIPVIGKIRSVEIIDNDLCAIFVFGDPEQIWTMHRGFIFYDKKYYPLLKEIADNIHKAQKIQRENEEREESIEMLYSE